MGLHWVEVEGVNRGAELDRVEKVLMICTARSVLLYLYESPVIWHTSQSMLLPQTPEFKIATQIPIVTCHSPFS